MILICALYSACLAYVSAVIDAYRIKLLWGLVPSLNHNFRLIIRCAIISLFCFIVEFKSLISLESYIPLVSLIVSNVILFSTFFDLILNQKRGLETGYIGSTAYFDQKARAIFGKYGGVEYAIFKLILSILFLLIKVK